MKTRLLFILLALLVSLPASAQRLLPNTGTKNLADVTGATVVYYGALTLALSPAHHPMHKVFDIFLHNNTICTGPFWTNPTTRVVTLTVTLSNAAAMDCRNSSGSVSVAVGAAQAIGALWVCEADGTYQMRIQPVLPEAGGNENRICLQNYIDPQPMFVQNRDGAYGALEYSWGTCAWNAAHGAYGFRYRVSWVDGLGIVQSKSTYTVSAYGKGFIGVSINNASTPADNVYNSGRFGVIAGTTADHHQVSASATDGGRIGVRYAQAMEFAEGPCNTENSPQYSIHMLSDGQSTLEVDLFGM